MKSSSRKNTLSSRVGVALVLLALPALVLVNGCGGGSSNQKTSSASIASRFASATVNLVWPAPVSSRLIPVASNSVRITISSDEGFHASQVIARPATSATFPNLPTGTLTVMATAHSDTLGEAQPAQASSVQAVTAVADEQFVLSLTMASTIDRLALTQSATGVTVGNSATFAVTALDASGNVVLTSNATWQWTSSNGTAASVTANGMNAVVMGLASGTSTIGVTETESGKTASVSLTVAPAPTPTPSPTPTPDPLAGIKEYLSLDLNNLPNYANPTFPVHYDGAVLDQDNTPPNNPVTNRGATLGRILFFDRRLSINDTVSCASCHQQNTGFTDARRFSVGFDGVRVTSAHAMRLANVRFYTGRSMFWDKRAASVEVQATQPIQNEIEMGFDAAHSGLAALITKMQSLPYYPELFRWVYGDTMITEERIQRALAQYERSMVSVSSRFDTGFAQVFNPTLPQAGAGQPFPNLSNQENRGKQLFLSPPNQGGGGCVACHSVPSFALTANSRSNGLDAGETRIFKSPSLKNVALTGPYMHDGRFQTLEQVVDHYTRGVQDGPALDNRLRPNGQPQRLPLTVADRDALVAFLKTLNDPTLIGDPKFANPFVK